MDSKMSAVRAALATESGDEEWSAYSSALQRKFLRLDRYLKGTNPPTEKILPSAQATLELK
jgi:hypothetical protein